MGYLASKEKKNIDWNVEGSNNFPFKKAKELERGKAYPLKGIFFTPDTKGFGIGTCIISDGFNVNCPKSFEAKAKSYVEDPDAVAAIKAGTEFFKVQDHVCKNGMHAVIITLC